MRVSLIFICSYKLGKAMEQDSSISIITGRNAAPPTDRSQHLDADKYNMKLLSSKSIRTQRNSSIINMASEIYIRK